MAPPGAVRQPPAWHDDAARGPSTHQIQAPDRTSPALPLKKGRVGTMTDDYKRHGTTLFAALDGKVIQGVLEHPARSSCASCARLDHATPAGLDLHLILDNYTPPTKPRRSSAGWSGIPASTSTSPRPRRRGPTPLKASLPAHHQAAPTRGVPLEPRAAQCDRHLPRLAQCQPKRSSGPSLSTPSSTRSVGQSKR
jgi:hypothetical protein